MSVLCALRPHNVSTVFAMTTSFTDHAVLTGTSSPSQRLAASRQRLMVYMASGDDYSSGSDQNGVSHEENAGGGNTALHKLVHTVRVWWRHHPAKMALEIAEPALQQYARHKPYQLIGMAAAAGIATVFIRPWRLVSITGLLLATAKSSGLASMALSLASSQFKSYGSKQSSKPD